MNKLIILLIVVAAVAAKENWAVLVAGSDGFWNYRHQADVFHAYQILKKNGIPEDKIILFAYDDIANNSRNPIEGKVFNKKNGYDVYEGVKIDYRGGDVTPQNFINVLLGKKEEMKDIGSGKVLESTSEDNVFIFFSDHGSTSLIAFPEGYLYANDLNKTLTEMHEKNTYGKMVIYIEACYSGSMFKGILPDNISIYATTAANAGQSSYAYYCGDDAVVNGTDIGSCLGDEYSIHWMENSDDAKMDEFTVGAQFDLVKEQTKMSQCQEYGDVEIKKDTIGEYQSHKSTILDYLLGYFKSSPKQTEKAARNAKKVKNEDMKLYYLKRRAEQTNDADAIKEYENELFMAARSAKIFDLFKREFNLSEEVPSPKDIDFDCYKQSVEWYTQLCGMDIDRDHKYINYIASFSTLKMTSWRAYHAFKSICSGL